jgi:hypothetical protein
MELSDQLQDPAALPPEKEPPVPIGYEVGWAPEAEERKIVSLLGFELCYTD